MILSMGVFKEEGSWEENRPRRLMILGELLDFSLQFLPSS